MERKIFSAALALMLSLSFCDPVFAGQKVTGNLEVTGNAQITGSLSASNVSGTNTGDQAIGASCEFNGLSAFSTTVSRRARTAAAKTTSSYQLTADASGTASVTIKKCSYANYPSTLTTIDTITLSAQKNTGSLSVSLDAGDYIIFELTACSGIDELLVELY